MKEIFTLKNILWVDVREKGEIPVFNNNGVLQIPLSIFERNIGKLNKNKTLVLFCQQGIRSKQAATICKQQNFNNCYSLKEGASELINFLKSEKYENHQT